MRGVPTSEGTEHIAVAAAGAGANGQRDPDEELDAAITAGVTTELQRS